MKHDELVGRLTLCIDDPMWADHAEVSKSFLRTIRAALAEAEHRERALVEALTSLHIYTHLKEPTYTTGHAGYDATEKALASHRTAAGEVKKRDQGPLTSPNRRKAMSKELIEILREAYGYTTAANSLLPERIKAAIARFEAQPAQGEAVALIEDLGKGGMLPRHFSVLWLDETKCTAGAKLYLAPPSTVPLSEHERVKAELADALARLAQYEGADDEAIDRMLRARIPGGSKASWWFVPHDSEQAKANIRDVVRCMLRALIPKPDVEV